MCEKIFPLTERITGSGQALPGRRSVLRFIVILFAISWGHNAMSQTRDEIETRNKKIVQAGFDAWSFGTGSPYDLLS